MTRSFLVGVASAATVLGLVGCGGPAGFGVEDPTVTESPLGSFNVLTRNYDNLRSGANLAETTLNTTNVNSSQFGRLFQLSVDDQVYAGLLYASGVSIAGGTHNVVYVATVNNTIYAFDADSGGSPLWQRNFNGGGVAVFHTQVGFVDPWCNPYNDFSGNIGIVGTPVIDGTAGTMYFVTRTVEGGSTFIQRLRGISLTDGSDRAGSPKVITATVPGSGDNSSGGIVSFDPKQQNQRAALALAGNNIYIAWSGHCDARPYHGWAMAYDKSSFNQTGVFNPTPNGGLGGIWQSGGGPLVDASGNVYYGTGNGFNDSAGSIPGLANSFVKLSASSLGVLSSFTASNWSSLNGTDNDFGSGGPAFVPGTGFIFTGGKEGVGYLLNSANLGGLVSGDTQIQQRFQAVDTSARPTATHHVHSSSTFWQSPQGLNMYVWGENDFLRAYRFNTSTQNFNTPAQMTGSVLSPLTNAGMPGGFMAISANGSASGSGILWATTPTSQDANHATVAGSLRAFNAEGSGTSLPILWDSTNLSGQSMGNLAKYNPPLVAKARVYIPTFSNVVNVYGLQSPFNGVTASIPGMIQAENFDLGRQGVAYSDTDTANMGGAYRTAESVDIEATADSGGGFNVGWIAAGEWLEYTANVTAGNYTLSARVASMAAGSMTVQFDGTTIGTISFTNTAGWQNWQTFTASGTPALAGGKHVVRVTFNNGCNLNWINFAGSGGGQGPFGGTPWAVPGTIEAENFDTGGQGVAYNDAEAANQGGQYRTSEGVDIEATADTGGGFNVGWTSAGEWVEYTVNVTSTPSNVSLRLASGFAGTKTVHVVMDPDSSAVNLTGPVNFAFNNGWQAWSTVTVPIAGLTTGSHVLRVVFDTSGTNLNWFGF